MRRLKNYLIKIYHLICKKEMRILPGNLAFFLVLSIMPFLTLVTFLSSFFAFSINDIYDLVSQFLPYGVEEVIKPLLTQSNINLSFIMMIVGFVISSNGTHSIIIISNMLYGINDREYISRRIKAFLILIMLMLIFGFMLIVIAFGNNILSFILNLNFVSELSEIIYDNFILIKYPIAFILTYVLIKSIYTMAPDCKIPSKTVSKGAFFTTVCTIIVTALYSFYTNNIANYDLWYGNLSNLIILMIWVYIIAYIFVIGIAINANEYNNSKNSE